jgi:phosphonate transport system substrate-binding protein
MRLGFSPAMFSGVNLGDARNTIKAVATGLAREKNIPADPEPQIYEGVDDALRMLRERLIGATTMTISEFWLLRREIRFDRFLVTSDQGKATENYVVLVRAASDVATLADLRSKHLNLLAGPSMALATVWLDVELAKLQLPPTATLLGSVVDVAKPAKTILPVFFGQTDACLVTRRTFDTMVELNPQVGRQLRVLASSPALVAALFGFRADLSPNLKERTIHELISLHDSVGGRQALAMFYNDGITEIPAAFFDSSLALLDEHARLCPKTNAAMVAALHGSSRPHLP